MWLDDNLYILLFTGIKVTLENMLDNGVILVVTDAGTKQKNLEREIRELSKRKNIKIFFVFSPQCRAKCENSLPVYRRLSDGRMFNRTDFDQDIFFKSVVHMVCNHSPTPNPKPPVPQNRGQNSEGPFRFYHIYKLG